jgi:signal transduction histidine kinase
MRIMTASGARELPQTAIRFRDQRVQVGMSVLAVVLSWIWLRPLGIDGLDGLVLALLLVNSIFVLGRHLPNGLVPPAWDVPLLCCWALTASALLSLRSLGLASAFAYFVAGHAGYRLRVGPAAAVATLDAGLSAGFLAIAHARGIPASPWVVGLTVALPVFLGMANRSRDAAVASTLEAARSAQRAAESEAREQALAERARISRDIHDVLAHSLSGVSMQLELSEMLLDGGDPDRAREAIGRAHSMVREGMVEARRAVGALRAEVLPLAQTLQAQFWGAGDVTVVGAPTELSTEATQTLIRAAQEALTNARRHAPGGALQVRLDYRPHEVELVVDNGPAPAGRPSAQSLAGSGMGLVGMRERAALLGGRVDAGPILDGPLAGGWRVLVGVPAEPGPVSVRRQYRKLDSRKRTS